MTPQEFLNTILPAAQACNRAHGIPASFTMAQAAIESGWGARALGCNLFGVKADKSWRGATRDVNTHEFIDGKLVPMVCKFRSYPDWNASIDDRASFFSRNPRYSKCFAEKTGEGWARAVAAAGYATDPDYANKLISTIRARNLARFDVPKEIA